MNNILYITLFGFHYINSKHEKFNNQSVWSTIQDIVYNIFIASYFETYHFVKYFDWKVCLCIIP